MGRGRPDPSIRARLLTGTPLFLAAASLAPHLVLPDRLEARRRRALDHRTRFVGKPVDLDEPREAIHANRV